MMPTLGDYIDGGSGPGLGFGFEHGETVERLRAGFLVDRYSKKPIREDWSDPDVLEIPNASISSLSQSQADGTQRRQVMKVSVLTVTDPDADVALGDRIRRGAEIWECVEFPESDQNPFTGWRPTLVMALKEVHG